MPTYEPRGTRKRGAAFPCSECDHYVDRPDCWGGECVNPESPAIYWEEGGFHFTAPNDTCRGFESVQALYRDSGGCLKPVQGAIRK